MLTAKTCETCKKGCNCQAGTPGCAHYACWGITSDQLYNSCPGVKTKI